MSENRIRADTAAQDFQDFLRGVHAQDHTLLKAVALTTPSLRLRERIDREIGLVEKPVCNAEVIQLRY